MHPKEEYKCIVMVLLLNIAGVRTNVIIVQLYCLLTMRRERVGTFRPCEILDQGRKSCRFDSCKHCRSDWNIHYKL